MKKERNTTDKILTTIISLLTIVTIIGTFVSKQTEMEIRIRTLEEKINLLNEDLKLYKK